jgi:hypothetical protein
MRLVDLLFDMIVEAQYALVQFKATVKKQADIARQHAMQHAVIDRADFLEIELVALGRFVGIDLSREHGALHHNPRHDRRQAQRDARHLAGVKRFQAWVDARLVVFAEQMEIFMRFGKKAHRLVKYAGHENNVRRIGANWNSGLHVPPHMLIKPNYTADFLDFLLRFDEILANQLAK